MKHIPLTQGKLTVVDDEDYEWLMQWKWNARRDRAGRWYAARAIPDLTKRHKQTAVLMHRVITNAPPDMWVDHKNHNALDNRRDNLRVCTPAGNSRNARIRSDNRSGYKGVGWHKKFNRWRARIIIDGRRHDVGHFRTPLEAALAYDRAAREHYGEFAHTNFNDTPSGQMTLPLPEEKPPKR